jgi:hypothetical protein
LDLALNFADIEKEFEKADGGAGGGFFYFSYDRKLIIKTINKEELNSFLEKIEDYFKYFQENPDSFIAKFYGIYSFERYDVTDEKKHVFITRNITNCPSKYILRSYDLKGSTFSREVLKKKPDANLSKVTLKDIDF